MPRGRRERCEWGRAGRHHPPCLMGGAGTSGLGCVTRWLWPRSSPDPSWVRTPVLRGAALQSFLCLTGRALVTRRGCVACSRWLHFDPLPRCGPGPGPPSGLRERPPPGFCYGGGTDPRGACVDTGSLPRCAGMGGGSGRCAPSGVGTALSSKRPWVVCVDERSASTGFHSFLL